MTINEMEKLSIKGLTGSRSPLPFIDRESDELCENLEA
jgi:hypothetical protein